MIKKTKDQANETLNNKKSTKKKQIFTECFN